MSLTSKTLWVPQPTTQRGTGVHLSFDRKSNRLAYASNKSVILRDVGNPEQAEQYDKHVHTTTVAKFSPSGQYLASGDAHGNVKVWSCGDGDQITKGEYTVLTGRVNDIAWDGDSQRIIAVGEGKESYGKCLSADSGNTVGHISGHTAAINAVAIRPVRPYKALTCSDDSNLVFYDGPPFKFNSSINLSHSNFVQDVQFSPSGEYAVSVGLDRDIVLYEGKSGSVLHSFAKQHAGGIYAVAWAFDSKTFATASADTTVKLWDVTTRELLHTWTFSEKKIQNYQVGVVFTSPSSLVSLSLNGDLNYLDLERETPSRVVRGHQKGVTALIFKDHSIVSGSYDGPLLHWALDETHGPMTAKPLNDQTSCVGIASSKQMDHVYAVALDDTMSMYSLDKLVTKVDLETQPKGISCAGKFIAVQLENEVRVFDEMCTPVAKSLFPSTAVTCTASSDRLLAVGLSNCKIQVLEMPKCHTVTDIGQIRAAPTCLEFSPAGDLLAAGDAFGKITVFNVNSKDVLTTRWSFHTSRITGMAWHPDGDYVATASSDTHLIVYSVHTPTKNYKVLNAHKEGVQCVFWLDDTTIASGGHDGTIKQWAFHPKQ